MQAARIGGGLMAYKIAGMQLDMHWRLDDWPDEIRACHTLTPNVSRTYVDEWRVRELEALVVDMWHASDDWPDSIGLRMEGLGITCSK